MSRLGNYFVVDDLSGHVISPSIGPYSLHDSAFDGITLGLDHTAGMRIARVIPLGITNAQLAREAGRYIGGNLVASDVDPGGVFSLRNLTGFELYVEFNWIDVTTNPVAACTLDVGVSVNPMPAGGAKNLWDGLDIRNAGVPKFWDTRWAGDHGGAGKIASKWANGSWLSGTVVAGGASAGLVGKWAAKVTRMDNLLLVL